MANDVFRVRDKETGEVFTVREKVRQDVPETGVEKQNILGQAFNVPGAAIRSAIQGKGYAAGAAQPSQVPRFQELAAQGASNLAGRLPPQIAAPVGGALSAVGQGVGLAADIATQPADMALMLAGKLPGTQQAAKMIGAQVMKLKPAQALGRFLTKPRHLKAVKDALGGKVNAIDEIATNFVDAAKKMKKDFVSKWQPEVDDAVKSITKNVNTTSQVDDVAFAIDDILERTPDIVGKKQLLGLSKELKSSPKTATQLNAIKSRISLPKSVKSGKAAPTPSQAAKMKVIHDIESKILELGGEKYSGIKARYREMSRAYADTMSVFMEGYYPGGAKVTKPWIAPGFGISPRQTRSLGQVSQYGGKDPMAAFNAWRVKKLAGSTAVGVGAGIGSLFLRRKGLEAVEEVIPGNTGQK